MADFNYLKSQRTADKLITKFGGKLGGKRVRTGKGNGPKSNPGKGVPVETPITCVVVDYTVRERQDSAIQRTSKRMLVSPLGAGGSQIDITLDDQVVGPDGTSYNIIPPLTILKPKDIVVLWDLQVSA